jgi:hypothetical protein
MKHHSLQKVFVILIQKVVQNLPLVTSLKYSSFMVGTNFNKLFDLAERVCQRLGACTLKHKGYVIYGKWTHFVVSWWLLVVSNTLP